MSVRWILLEKIFGTWHKLHNALWKKIFFGYFRACIGQKKKGEHRGSPFVEENCVCEVTQRRP